jgi:hypothetical protein
MAYPEDPGHPLTHSAGCGHVAIEHQGHRDYLHSEHLHSVCAAPADST